MTRCHPEEQRRRCRGMGRRSRCRGRMQMQEDGQVQVQKEQGQGRKMQKYTQNRMELEKDAHAERARALRCRMKNKGSSRLSFFSSLERNGRLIFKRVCTSTRLLSRPAAGPRWGRAWTTFGQLVRGVAGAVQLQQLRLAGRACWSTTRTPCRATLYRGPPAARCRRTVSEWTGLSLRQCLSASQPMT